MEIQLTFCTLRPPASTARLKTNTGPKNQMGPLVTYSAELILLPNCRKKAAGELQRQSSAKEHTLWRCLSVNREIHLRDGATQTVTSDTLISLDGVTRSLVILALTKVWFVEAAGERDQEFTFLFSLVRSLLQEKNEKGEQCLF